MHALYVMFKCVTCSGAISWIFKSVRNLQGHGAGAVFNPGRLSSFPRVAELFQFPALHALYKITCFLLPQRTIAQFKALSVQTASYCLYLFLLLLPFIFFTCVFLFLVRGALEHIPACIGMKVRRHFGQAASQSQSQSPIHFELREESCMKKCENMQTETQ